MEDRSLQIYAYLAPLVTRKVLYPFGKSVLDQWSFRSISWNSAKSFLEPTTQSLFQYYVICKKRVAGSFGISLEERSLVIGFFLSLW